MDDLEEHLGLHKHLVDDDGDSSDNNSTRGGKRLKLPLVQSTLAETIKETGFNQSSRMCLEQIREAMLHHRWHEAAEYMACYPQIFEEKVCYSTKQYKELVWRASTEILHHHPNSTMGDYNIIYERMKHSGFKLYLKVSLEHSFHLMLQGKFEDAKQNLAAAESWRYGKQSSAQIQRTKLIQAYRSLLDYIIWSEKKIVLSNNNTFDAFSENQGVHNYFRQASVNLKDILSTPGVWDPFILSYVEMLEFYEDHEEALKVLNDYAFDNSFPPNPNAHVYLYKYLKRHGTSQNELIKVLKNLQYLVPSHELMLEYSSLLLQSSKEKPKNIQKALGIVLEMLDFACWRSNLDVWMCLKTIIHKLQAEDNWESIISETMTSRKEWWPALHFTRFHARKESEENPELLEVKAPLAKILCSDQALKYTAEPVTSGECTSKRHKKRSK